MYTYRLVDDGINVFRDSMPAANVVYVAANGLLRNQKYQARALAGARAAQWTFCCSTRRIPAATTIRFAGLTSTSVDGRCVLDRCVLLRYFGTYTIPLTPPYRFHHWHQQRPLGLADHLWPFDDKWHRFVPPVIGRGARACCWQNYPFFFPSSFTLSSEVPSQPARSFNLCFLT